MWGGGGGGGGGGGVDGVPGHGQNGDGARCMLMFFNTRDSRQHSEGQQVQGGIGGEGDRLEMTGITLQFLQGGVRHQAAVGDNQRTRAELRQFIRVTRRDDQRHVLLQRLDQPGECMFLIRREAFRWFVHQQHKGRVQNGLGDPDFALQPDGQGVEGGIERRQQFQARGGLFHACTLFGAFKSIRRCDVVKEFFYGQSGMANVSVKLITNQSFDFARLSTCIQALNIYISTGGEY